MNLPNGKHESNGEARMTHLTVPARMFHLIDDQTREILSVLLEFDEGVHPRKLFRMFEQALTLVFLLSRVSEGLCLEFLKCLTELHTLCFTESDEVTPQHSIECLLKIRKELHLGELLSEKEGEHETDDLCQELREVIITKTEALLRFGVFTRDSLHPPLFRIDLVIEKLKKSSCDSTIIKELQQSLTGILNLVNHLEEVFDYPERMKMNHSNGRYQHEKA